MAKKEIKNLVAYYILMLRKMNNFTQQDIAKRLGKSVNAISNWELGNTSPPVDDLVDLCKMFDVTPNQIMGWDECPKLKRYINETEGAKEMVEELQKQKAEIEKKIKRYKQIMDHKK